MKSGEPYILAREPYIFRLENDRQRFTAILHVCVSCHVSRCQSATSDFFPRAAGAVPVLPEKLPSCLLAYAFSVNGAGRMAQVRKNARDRLRYRNANI